MQEDLNFLRENALRLQSNQKKQKNNKITNNQKSQMRRFILHTQIAKFQANCYSIIHEISKNIGMTGLTFPLLDLALIIVIF